MDVHRAYAIIDWCCQRCMERTGKRQTIGQVLRSPANAAAPWQDLLAVERPGTAPHATFSGDLRAVYDKGRTRLVAIEADCTACRDAGEGVDSPPPQLSWEELDGILEEMRRQGETQRTITPG